MKKIFTYSVAAMLMSMSLPAFAQDAAPVLTMTVERDAVEETFAFQISAEGGATIQVDWGDGELKSYSIVNYDDAGWVFSEVSGTVAGTQIKVYAPDASKINYLDASKNLSDGENAFLRAIDLSQMTAVKELTLSGNHIANLDTKVMSAMTNLTAKDCQLTSLTLPDDGTNLTTIDVSNTVDVNTGQLTDASKGNNQVLATDWSMAPNLTSLKVSGNSYKELGWFDDFDVSANSKLTTLDINCCYIPSLDVTHMTGLKTFNAQWNEFTRMNLTNMNYSNATVWLTHNNLTSVTFKEGASGMTRVNLAYNALTFATLPAAGLTKSAANYVYNNQEKLILSLDAENTVNLSDQKVGDTMSKVVWTAILDGQTEPTELSEANAQYNETEPGVFRFNVPVKDLSGVITNEALPNLSLATTTATSVGLLPEMLTLEVVRSETADGIFLGLIDSEGQNVYIDWGDGKYAGPYTIEKNGYDYSPTMPGVKVAESWWDDDEAAPLKGNTIKVKGNPETIVTVQARANTDWTTGEPTTAQVKSIDLSKLTNLEKVSLDKNVLTTVDLSNNTQLKSVSLLGNKLTSFDFTLPELITLNIANEVSGGKVTYGENKISTLDFEKLPELVSLTSDGNGLVPDFSKATKLTTVYLQVNEITEFAPVSASLGSLSMNYSTKLTSFDGSGLTSGSVNLFFNNNAMGATKDSFKTSESMNNVNIANGKFTFATLPALNSVKGTLTYSPQSAMAAEYKNGNVDLTSQAKVGDTATAYVWKQNDAAVEDVTATADGIFTFKYNGEYICSMTNAAYPNLTLNTVPVTVTGLQDRPVKLFSFTVAPEAVGSTMLLNISSTDNQSVMVDWGNGTLSDPVATKDYSTTWEYGMPTGTVAGSEITVYGTDAATINQLDLSYDKQYGEATKILSIDLAPLSGLYDLALTSNAISSLDLTGNTALAKLYIESNKITEIKFAENNVVDRIDAPNTAELGSNDLFKVDLSKAPKLNRISINFNNKEGEATTFDFSKVPELATLYATDCNMTTVDFSNNAKLSYATLNNNQLTELDLSTMLANSSVFAMNNNIEKVVMPEAKMKALNINNNKFTFATLPALDKVTTLTYNTQKPMVAKAEGAVVDLSSQAKVGDTETVYTWAVGTEEFKDFTVSNGVCTFTKSAEGAICSMTNAEYPKLTLTTIPVNVEVAGSGVEELEAAEEGEEGEAVYFNLQGVKVDGTAPGVYIRVLNGKSQKVIVK